MTEQLHEIKTLPLKESSMRVRKHIIRMAARGGCYVGSALSCADILVFLYAGFLKISKETFREETRNYFFLSKGHAVPALYAVFAEIGLLDPERLEHHLGTDDSIYWHPNTSIPGVEFHAGSLGHILPVAAGVALDCAMRDLPNRVVALLGDGELNEGSVWESLLVASARRLQNLIIVIDRNRFQANCATEELIPLEPLAEKFLAFGAAVRTVDGHDFAAIEKVFRDIPFEKGKPNVVIAQTVRGKGLPELENRADKWFCNYSEEEAERLVMKLRG
ncbi:MAG: 1-deoxy-D-xylulose-5-phosphate synthase N-terminal domain-containing protein [Thermodesulfovibrionales bacterium]